MKRLPHLAIIFSSSIAQGDLLTVKEIHEAELPTAPEWHIEKKWNLGEGNTFQAQFNFTKKGNGGLHLGNSLWVSIWDCHENTSVFSGELLQMTLKDLNQDGVLDLQITGSIVFHDEDGDTVIHREPVHGEFLYSLKEGSFKIENLHMLNVYQHKIEQEQETEAKDQRPTHSGSNAK